MMRSIRSHAVVALALDFDRRRPDKARPRSQGIREPGVVKPDLSAKARGK